ncbi:unnamed protein product [Polarella glacialis]|uniref:Ricin B lectin domain-containing protein n=1 Tax=Polarella glacialis TaxID=89957 RepID=A0A813GGT7_POLGL|nr:unnamed protein product [Polarella glacialis]
MSDDDQGSMECNHGLNEPHPLDPARTWETFQVVDAGHGQVALYNPCHQRFLRMNGNDGSSPDGGAGKVSLDGLREDWMSERWQFADLGGGRVSVYSPSWKRFLRVESDGKVNGLGGTVDSGNLPPNWGGRSSWSFQFGMPPFPLPLSHAMVPHRGRASAALLGGWAGLWAPR